MLNAVLERRLDKALGGLTQRQARMGTCVWLSGPQKSPASAGLFCAQSEINHRRQNYSWGYFCLRTNSANTRSAAVGSLRFISIKRRR